jgi:hypothetical protein
MLSSLPHTPVSSGTKNRQLSQSTRADASTDRTTSSPAFASASTFASHTQPRQSLQQQPKLYPSTPVASNMTRSHSAPSIPNVTSSAPATSSSSAAARNRHSTATTHQEKVQEYELVPVSRQALIKEERARMGRMLQRGLACALGWSGAKAVGISIRLACIPTFLSC